MQFIPMPSLEHITLVKAAVTLWNEDKIRDIVAQFCRAPLFDFEIHKRWVNVVEEVKKNVSTLNYPKILKEKLLNYVGWIGEELLKWINDYERCFYPACSKKILGEIVWTCAGKIDNKETTKNFVQDEDIALSKRFILACLSCLEEVILELWNKLSALEKEYFIGNEGYLFIQNQLISYWVFHMNGNLATLQDTDFYMLVDCVKFCNIQGVKYFWSRLSSVPTFQKRSLLPIFTDFFESHFDLSLDGTGLEHGCSEVICFLLSKMSPEEKMEAMKLFPSEILKCYLEWPLQSMFSNISEIIFPWLTNLQFRSLLYYIIKYIKKYTTKLRDNDYQMLLGEFWRQSPRRFKNYIFEKDSYYLFSNLMSLNDRCNIGLILQTASMKERDDIIFKHLSIIVDPFDKEKFDLLRFFILQCIFSKERLLDFRRNCERYFEHMYYLDRPMRLYTGKWDSFFKLLDDLIIDFEEDSDDIKQNPPKRLCI